MASSRVMVFPLCVKKRPRGDQRERTVSTGDGDAPGWPCYGVQLSREYRSVENRRLSSLPMGRGPSRLARQTRARSDGGTRTVSAPQPAEGEDARPDRRITGLRQIAGEHVMRQEKLLPSAQMVHSIRTVGLSGTSKAKLESTFEGTESECRKRSQFSTIITRSQ